MQNETDGLLHYLFHNRNVLRTVDHRRLLELCRELEFPDPETLRMILTMGSGVGDQQ